MQKLNRATATALVIGLLGGQTLWAGWSLMTDGVLERDAKRLETARTNHVADVDKAFDIYSKQVERANEKLARIYEQVIRQYENRGASVVVESLKSELEELQEEALTLPFPEPVKKEEGEEKKDEENEKKDEIDSAEAHAKLISWIGPEIVNASGQRAPTSRIAEYDHILLYFTASWCGPCRAFTPQLIQFYNDNRSLGKWEVVVVSGDFSQTAFEDYLLTADMPWAAVPYHRLESSGLVDRFSGGWPRMVVLDKAGKTVMKGNQPMIHDFREFLMKNK